MTTSHNQKILVWRLKIHLTSQHSVVNFKISETYEDPIDYSVNRNYVILLKSTLNIRRQWKEIISNLVFHNQLNY